MGLLRLAVLGPPEVVHDGSRLAFPLHKAQALLLYLAVEGGMHSRGKLAAFLWPDSEPPVARKALRNALALRRHLLADHDASSVQHSHLLSSGDLLGLDPQTPRELDLDVVQRALNEAQRLTTPLAQEQHAALLTGMQYALALVRGPFLDGFWLSEDSPFDEWIEQQQQQWQVRLSVLFDRLSSWLEESGEQEQVKATLARWLVLDPLAEEAYRRLIRVYLVLGDPTTALRVYVTCRARLAEALQINPSAETVALAEHIRASAAARRKSQPTHSSSAATAQSRPPGELVVPLVGRQASFSQLVRSFQQVRRGQPQAVFLEGEAGIGKTRLAREWVAWAAAQGALVLAGQAFEMGGRLPYQPLIEALRPRLEAENAPEDLLEDLWLAELSRLLPELRMRYPDLPAPSEDELTAKPRLFEAVARLFDALAKRAPLVLLLDDLHWVDEATLDLVRYLGRHWSKQSSRALLLVTLRSDQLELNPALAAHLADLGRDLPVSQVTLQTLSRGETIHLVQTLAGERAQNTKSEDERPEHGPDQSLAGALSSSELKTKLSGLGEVLFAQTDGQPLYLLETLKLLRDRQWLVPQIGTDGILRLELAGELETIVAQGSSGSLLPPSVRALILARLTSLSPAARHLVMASAVLETAASAQRLWQVAEVEMQAGVEALEEAVKSGILREEEAGVGRLGSYRFSHCLIGDVVYTELGAARRQVLHQRALARLEREGARASELAYHARASGEAEAAYRYSVQAGMEAVTVFAVADAIRYYEQARALLQEDQRLQTVLSAPEVERLYAHLGRAYAFQNDREKAWNVYEELLAYARHHDQFTLACMTLNRLAILAVQQSFDKPRASSLLEEALQMAQRSSDQRLLAETEWNLAQIMVAVWDDPTGALSRGERALSLAQGIQDQELEARSLCLLGWIHLQGGDFGEAIPCLEASLTLYARLSQRPTASRELSVTYFLIGSPLTQPLTNQATEALCWAFLALGQVNSGQVQNSIDSSRKALALAQESKNVWTQIYSSHCLTQALLEAGAYEEALGLMQHTTPLARTLPLTINFQRFLTALCRTYHAMQQWEEAQAALQEAEAFAETLDLRPSRVPALSRLCMHYAVATEWEQAYRYAVRAIALRQSFERALIAWDFYRPYETEALLRGGDVSQAWADVQRLGEHLGPNLRFRIPYLRSLAVLAEWEGHGEQAIGHLREAAGLAVELGLPAERWQIQAALGTLHEAAGDPAQAHIAWASASRIIQEMAQGIKDEALRSRFLAGPQIHPVLQHAQSEAPSVSQDHP